jgi:uncharacterized protein (DUF1330 family)|tara:strand:+ start:1599 stop:2039 length:441 start_codon:yes stop_codon:yes gene_type:complete
MEVRNAVSPTKNQLKEFFEPEAKSPIYMVNLLKFYERAKYEDGRQSELTGREAYGLYARAVAQLITQVGGQVGFSGEVSRLMLGEVESLWDEVGIAMYPSRAAMMEMIQLPEYAEINIHRTAGLAGQLNIETIAGKGPWLSHQLPE